jgi:23S rRNA pseudouridine1911/1915/1917 synthase
VTTRHAFTVPEALDGVRLDRCLAELHPEWSRSRVRKLIDGGYVAFEGRPARAAAVVRTGLKIVVDEPPPETLTTEAEAIPLDILHEDEDLLVLNKPAGLVIHPAAGNPKGTLVNALLHHCKDLSGIGGVERPGIVHRLDKDTTGLMVVAKSDRAHLALSIAFRQRRMDKTYLAVCYGVPREGDGVVDAPIRRHPSERQRMAVARDGRAARTLYHLEERFGGASLLSCRLVTGRTHQIRVHMAHIGHAVVGDTLYAGRQWRNLPDPEARAACRDFPRQALHAWRLGFVHPVTNEQVVFEAPPPADMAGLIAALRLHRSNV